MNLRQSPSDIGGQPPPALPCPLAGSRARTGGSGCAFAILRRSAPKHADDGYTRLCAVETDASQRPRIIRRRHAGRNESTVAARVLDGAHRIVLQLSLILNVRRRLDHDPPRLVPELRYGRQHPHRGSGRSPPCPVCGLSFQVEWMPHGEPATHLSDLDDAVVAWLSQSQEGALSKPGDDLSCSNCGYQGLMEYISDEGDAICPACLEVYRSKPARAALVVNCPDCASQSISARGIAARQ